MSEQKIEIKLNVEVDGKQEIKNLADANTGLNKSLAETQQQLQKTDQALSGLGQSAATASEKLAKAGKVEGFDPALITSSTEALKQNAKAAEEAATSNDRIRAVRDRMRQQAEADRRAKQSESELYVSDEGVDRRKLALEVQRDIDRQLARAAAQIERDSLSGFRLRNVEHAPAIAEANNAARLEAERDELIARARDAAALGGEGSEEREARIRSIYGERIRLENDTSGLRHRAAIVKEIEAAEKRIGELTRIQNSRELSDTEKIAAEREHMLALYGKTPQLRQQIGSLYDSKAEELQRAQDLKRAEEMKAAAAKAAALEKREQVKLTRDMEGAERRVLALEESELSGVAKINAERRRALELARGDAQLEKRVNAVFDRRVAEQRAIEAAGLHGNTRRLILGAKDLTEGYSRGAVIEGVDYLMSLRGPEGAHKAGSGFFSGFSPKAIGLIAGAGTAAAVAVLSKKMYELVKSEGEAAQGLENLADRMGLTVNQASMLSAEAKLAGVHIETIAQASRYLAQALEDPAGAGRKVANALHQMGVALFDSSGKERELGQVTLDVIRKLAQYPTAAEQVYRGTQVMGRGFKDLEPLIKRQQEFQRIAQSLGFADVEDVNRRLTEAHEQIEKMSLAWELFKKDLAADIAPIIIPGIRVVSEVFRGEPAAPLFADIKSGQRHMLSEKVAAYQKLQADAERLQMALKLAGGGENPGTSTNGQIDIGKALQSLRGGESLLRTQLANVEAELQRRKPEYEDAQKKIKNLDTIGQAVNPLESQTPALDRAIDLANNILHRQSEKEAKSYENTLPSLLAKKRDLESTVSNDTLKLVQGGFFGPERLRIKQEHDQAETELKKVNAQIDILKKAVRVREELNKLLRDSAAKARHDENPYAAVDAQIADLYAKYTAKGQSPPPQLAQIARNLMSAAVFEQRDKNEAQAYKLRRSATDADLEALERKANTAHRLAAIRSENRIESPLDVQSAYQKEIAIAREARAKRLHDLPKPTSDATKKLNDSESANIEKEFARAKAAADARRTLALAEIDKRRQDERRAADLSAAEHESQVQLENNHRLVTAQQRFAVLENGGQQTLPGVLGAAGAEQGLVQKQYLDRVAMLDDQFRKKEIDDIELATRKSDALYDKEKQLADLRLDTTLRLLELQHQAEDEAKQQGAALFDAIREHKTADFFREQLSTVSRNLFANAAAPAIQRIGQIVGATLPNEGVFANIFRGTIFDDPTRATKENTDALRALTAELRGNRLGAHPADAIPGIWEYVEPAHNRAAAQISRLNDHLRNQAAQPQYLPQRQSTLQPEHVAPLADGIDRMRRALEKKQAAESDSGYTGPFRTLGEIAALDPSQMTGLFSRPRRFHPNTFGIHVTGSLPKTPSPAPGPSVASQFLSGFTGTWDVTSVPPLVKRYLLDIPLEEQAKSRAAFHTGQYLMALAHQFASIPLVPGFAGDVVGAQMQLGQRAWQEMMQGHYVLGATHELDASIPLLGPNAVAITDELLSHKTGSVAKAAGQLAGYAIGGFLPIAGLGKVAEHPAIANAVKNHPAVRALVGDTDTLDLAPKLAAGVRYVLSDPVEKALAYAATHEATSHSPFSGTPVYFYKRGFFGPGASTSGFRDPATGNIFLSKGASVPDRFGTFVHESAHEAIAPLLNDIVAARPALHLEPMVRQGLRNISGTWYGSGEPKQIYNEGFAFGTESGEVPGLNPEQSLEFMRTILDEAKKQGHPELRTQYRRLRTADIADTLEALRETPARGRLIGKVLADETGSVGRSSGFRLPKGAILYHGTTPEGAADIAKHGFRTIAGSVNGESGVSLTSNRTVAEQIVRINKQRTPSIVETGLAPGTKLMDGAAFDALVKQIMQRDRLSYASGKDLTLAAERAAQEARRMGYDGADWRGRAPRGKRSLSHIQQEVRVWNTGKIVSPTSSPEAAVSHGDNMFSPDSAAAFFGAMLPQLPIQGAPLAPPDISVPLANGPNLRGTFDALPKPAPYREATEYAGRWPTLGEIASLSLPEGIFAHAKVRQPSGGDKALADNTRALDALTDTAKKQIDLAHTDQIPARAAPEGGAIQDTTSPASTGSLLKRAIPALGTLALAGMDLADVFTPGANAQTKSARTNSAIPGGIYGDGGASSAASTSGGFSHTNVSVPSHLPGLLLGTGLGGFGLVKSGIDQIRAIEAARHGHAAAVVSRATDPSTRLEQAADTLTVHTDENTQAVKDLTAKIDEELAKGCRCESGSRSAAPGGASGIMGSIGSLIGSLGLPGIGGGGSSPAGYATSTISYGGMVGAGGSGAPFSLPGAPPFFSVDVGGMPTPPDIAIPDSGDPLAGISGIGGDLPTPPAFSGGSLGKIGGAIGKYGGEALGAGLGAFQAFKGFSEGGGRGISQGIGGVLTTAAAIDPEPISKIALMVGAGIADLVSSFFGDPKQNRQNQETANATNAQLAGLRYNQSPVTLNVDAQSGHAIAYDKFGRPQVSSDLAPQVYSYQKPVGYDPFHPQNLLFATDRTLGFQQLPGFAAGGDPPLGRLSIVGENGPELFMPHSAGTILPNSLLRLLAQAAPVADLSPRMQDSVRRETPVAPEIHVHMSIPAMDAKDVMRRAPDIANAVVSQITGTNHPIQYHIKRLVSPA